MSTDTPRGESSAAGVVAQSDGIPQVGKTTMFRGVAVWLTQAGIGASVLVVDDLQQGLCSDLDFSDEDRTIASGAIARGA